MLELAMTGIDIEALKSIGILLFYCIAPTLAGELLARIAQQFMNIAGRRKEMIDNYDSYSAQYSKLVKSGKAIPTKDDQSFSMTGVPAVAEGSPALKTSATRFALAKQKYQMAEIFPRALSMTVMFLSYKLFISNRYNNIVVLQVPFKPWELLSIKKMVHSGLDNPGTYDAGMGFLYTLVSMGLRPVLLKLLRLEPERFVAPSIDG